MGFLFLSFPFCPLPAVKWLNQIQLIGDLTNTVSSSICGIIVGNLSGGRFWCLSCFADREAYFSQKRIPDSESAIRFWTGSIWFFIVGVSWSITQMGNLMTDNAYANVVY